MNENAKLSLGLLVLIISSVFLGYKLDSYDKKSKVLDTKLDEQVKANKTLREAAVLAVRLQTQPVWYVIDTNSVSTSPDGQGNAVKLDVPLRQMGSGRDAQYPDKNVRVSFYPSSPGLTHTVAQGLLHYSYHTGTN